MKRVVCILLLSSVVLALPAYASDYGCAGPVTLLFINSGGVVAVGGPGGLPPISICSVNGGYGPFSADTCKTIYATLLAAKLSGQNIQINFSDNLTCVTQPPWGNTGITSAWSVQTSN
jgi:hypothetical protein